MAKLKPARTSSQEPTTPDPLTALEQAIPPADPPPTPITIQSPIAYRKIADDLATLREARKRIVDYFNAPDPTSGLSIKQAALVAHRMLVEREKKALARVDPHIAVRDQALVAYDDQQARIAREAQETAAAALLAESELRRESQIAEAKQAGDKAAVRELTRAPIPVPFVAVQSATPDVDGLHFRETPKATVTDLQALVRGIARTAVYRELIFQLGTSPNAKRFAALLDQQLAAYGPAPTLECLEVKQSSINAFVKLHGADVAAKHGITVEQKKRSVSR
jgi:hypothetical protein